MARKKREGRRLRTLSPMAQVTPFIMTQRNGASNLVRDSINMERLTQYIREKKMAGHKHFNVMHVLVAAYLRTVAAYPGINRFVRGQRVFARNGIEVMMTIKKDMTLESPDTCIKMDFDASETALDVYEQFEKVINEYRANPGGDFDSFAKILTYLPSLIMKFFVFLIRFFDYYGLLPRRLTKLSPFHGSFFITSVASLGVPTIYHHLYDLGTVPIFMAFGKKYKKTELSSDGTPQTNSYVDFTIVMDERICDGFYFAAALKNMKSILKDPWQLDNPPEEVKEDIK